jgi:hypothetical protein
MWHPEPGWQQLPGGAALSTYGVWRGRVAGRDAVIKRLQAPGPHDPPQMSDPGSTAYWRREVEVARDDLVADSPGVIGAEVLDVTEDEEGATVVHALVDDAENPGLFLARSLGGLAAAPVPARSWLVRGQLRERLGHAARRGGWPTLQRTTAADVADHLWTRREHFLSLLDDLPQVLQHGDPTPGNLLGRDGARVVAVDWQSLGTGPAGHDLGLLALASREEFDPLFTAYAEAWDGDREAALLGARVTVAYTALSRAEWALARVAGGEGALAGKYRHPAVAPHLRALQRQFAQVEALL